MVEEIKVEGVFPVNTYFYIDDNTKSGFLIDPGAEPDKILDFIRSNNWDIEKILITHGHMDHIGGVNYLKEKLNIPVYIHKDDVSFLTDGYLNLSDNFGETIKVDNHSEFTDKEVIKLKSDPDFTLEVIHTPGHTPGSVIFYSKKDKIAFIGDLLFEHGPGLTHFPGANQEDMDNSIYNILFSLPEDTMIYSSHAEPILLSAQKQLLMK